MNGVLCDCAFFCLIELRKNNRGDFVMKSIYLIVKKVVFVSVILLLTSQAFAKPVSKEKADKAVKAFLVSRFPGSKSSLARTMTINGHSALGVKAILPLRVNDKLVGHIIDLEPAGFVLFAGDDEMPPVKIYSETGSYDNLPDGFKRVLELELLEDHELLSSPNRRSFLGQWNSLTSDEKQAQTTASLPTGTANASILTTTWNQDDPYNYYCPTASGGPDGRAYAGCTAAALAQILRHHSLPESVTSDHTYSDNFGYCQGTHSISDAGMGNYDWANMPSVITISSPEAQQQAVGQLMYHCGVALESNFEADGTSAYPSSIPSVLQTYFNYTCSNYQNKSGYTSTAWYDKISDDIDDNQPVFYGMWESDGSNGHAVVCDGYRNGNEIHLDLGWSGSGTIWYNIDSVSYSGYTWTTHGAVFDIAPTGNSAPILSNPRVSPLSGTTATNFEFLVDYYDADGDPPHPTYRTVTITGGYGGTMTLESGSTSDGTYHYVTTLPQGSYSYMFFFSDINNEHDQTPFYSGPYVPSTEQVPINIEIKCKYIAQDLELEYSLVGNTGPWIKLPIIGQFLDPLLVPAAVTVWFHASVASDNYDYLEWNLYEDGEWITWGPGAIWGITLGTETTSVGLDVRYDYTPQNYTISGTVLRGDGSPVPGGVDLYLESPEQSPSLHSSDGNFSFSNVRGGVSVSITPLADGYEFAPPALVYNNLHNNHTGEVITASASDVQAPMTSFLTIPYSVSDNSSISFSWFGEDNVTEPANLVYQYKLDGSDTDWTGSSSATLKSYDLANGVYTFWVRAEDEAGNINQDPSNYTFVVNAAPKVDLVVRIDKSVWASRVTLEMPVVASNPSNTFVLLPDHSGMFDPELVPVSIHNIGEDTPSGINEILASELGEPVRIIEVESGWLVTLPESIAAGDTVQYDIVWGKIKYSGWQEFVEVPYGFPNVGQTFPLWSRGVIEDSYLDENQNLWRIASRGRRYSDTYGDQKVWSLMNIYDNLTSIVDENVILYLPGMPYDDSYGEKYYIQRGDISKVGSNFFLMTKIEKYEKINVGGSSEYHDYEGYRLRSYDSSGNAINTYDAQWEDEYVYFPPSSIANELWIIGKDYNTSSAWYIVHDQAGNIRIPKTTYESALPGKGVSIRKPQKLGSNIIFPITRYWYTTEDDDRQELAYQVRDSNGGLIKATTVFTPPLLSDSVEKDDAYSYMSVLTDHEGKVWISFDHWQSGQPDEYYYIIIGADGNIWKGPIQTTTECLFYYCDKDGYIWANKDGQLHVLSSGDTDVISPRPHAFTPNQRMGSYEALVPTGGDGYRLYDRWSPRAINIDVPAGADFASMAVYDLNLWDNDLHPANINFKDGDTVVWNQSGQFTGHATVDMSGVLSEGQNLLTMTQDDFLGGQLLITFPYVIQRSLITSSTSGGSVTVPGEPGPYKYDDGSVVAIKADAELQYHFVSWSGDTDTVAEVYSDSTTISMNNDYTIQANFAIDQFFLTTSSTSGGSVTIPGEPGPFQYDAGSVVSIAAVADSNYHFVSWSGDTTTISNVFSNTTTIDMFDDYAIQANFGLDQYSLGTSSTSGGDVAVPGELGPYMYDYGSTVTITAVANPGYHFDGWIGDTDTIVDVNSETTTITIYADYLIQARFMANDVDHFIFSAIPLQQYVNAPFNLTITAVDADSNTIPTFNDTITLSGHVGPIAMEVWIGDGTASWYMPMMCWFEDARTQVIYLANEIGASGPINSIELDVDSQPGQTLEDWTIRMRHTSLSTYITPSWESMGWKTVYQNDESILSTGWAAFDFSSPFDYNDNFNLMVDFSFNNGSFSVAGESMYSELGGDRSIHFYSDSNDGDPLTWAGATPAPIADTKVPNIILGMGGDTIIISPTFLEFTNGVWNGNVIVSESASDMYLLANYNQGILAESNLFNVAQRTAEIVSIFFDGFGVPNIYIVGDNGLVIDLYASDDLVTWTAIASDIALIGGEYTHIDFAGKNKTARFYRVYLHMN
jgi:Peptidase C10 family/Divergent InlB B-repeat domain/Spi protease inhibitor